MGNFDYPWDIPEEKPTVNPQLFVCKRLSKEEEDQAMDDYYNELYQSVLRGEEQ